MKTKHTSTEKLTGVRGAWGARAWGCNLSMGTGARVRGETVESVHSPQSEGQPRLQHLHCSFVLC